MGKQISIEAILVGVGSVGSVIHWFGLWVGLLLIVLGITGLIWSVISHVKNDKKTRLELGRLMSRYDLVKGESEHHISDGRNSFYPEDDESALRRLKKHGIVKLEQRRTITPSFPLDYGYWTLTNKGNKEALKCEKDDKNGV